MTARSEILESVDREVEAGHLTYGAWSRIRDVVARNLIGDTMTDHPAADRPVHLIEGGSLVHAVVDAETAHATTDPGEVTCPLCRNRAARRPDLHPRANRPETTL